MTEEHAASRPTARQFARGQWLQRKDTPDVAGKFIRYNPRLAGHVDVWMPGRYTWISPADEWEPTSTRCPECGAGLQVAAADDELRPLIGGVATHYFYCPVCKVPR